MARPHLLPWILLFLLSLLSSTISSSYENPCLSAVPQPLKDGKRLRLQSLLMQYGYFRAQGKFPGQGSSSLRFEVPTVELVPNYISETSVDGVLHIRASLVFQMTGSYALPARSLYRVEGYRLGYGMWRHGYRRGVWGFDLDGYWSQPDGKLCMTGYGYGFWSRGNFTTLHSVLMLNLEKNSTILTTLVKGTLKSMDSDSGYFDPIFILGYNQNNYNYSLISQANNSCSGVIQGQESFSLGSNRRTCLMLRSLGLGFELEYESSCGSSNCNPLGKDFGFLPQFMALNVMGCSDEGKLHMYLTFSNTSDYTHAPPFLPSTSLVGEGFWDGEKNRLCIMACLIMNSTGLLAESFVGNCHIGMSLRFPVTLSITNRSRAVGKIWSSRSKNDSGYFDAISFRSLEGGLNVPGLKYDYTKTNWLRKVCNLKNEAKNSKNTYPSPASYNNDMRFSMHMRGSGWGFLPGYFVPLFLGDRFQDDSFRVASAKRSDETLTDLNQKLWNVSYVIKFTPPDAKWHENLSLRSHNYPKDTQISAEGIYNSDTGLLCMVGCHYLDLNFRNLSEKVDKYDCEISINVQFPPLNSSPGEQLNGTIKSTRNKSNPLYFEPIEFHSHVPYARQTQRVIKRMDFEIAMVLISLTLACLCVGSQVFYIKRHPEALPCVSLLMLGILTLGLMIRLVLNFEALFFTSRNKQNVFLWSGGWLEANEIIVRAITMVAFLLQFWLLQLTVSAKLAEKEWLSSEGRVLKWCIPLYLVGGLIAWLVHLIKTYGTSYPMAHHSLWEYLLSYAGLILDGFLLPQVLLNLFSNSKGKSLSVTFYVGMTLVRALPHAYDAYRAHHYLPWFGGSYIYANTYRDFYSTAWDIVIPCGGFVLAVLIFMQQRLGGGCILPPRFRRFAGYEQVAIVDGSGFTAEVECN